MKKVLVSLLLAVLGTAVLAQAQPDPRDSIILESKTVFPQSGTGGVVRLKVYITNKDSLTHITLALRERSVTGGAYMTFADPRNFEGVVEPLTSTLRYNGAVNFAGYNSVSPDLFKIAAGFSPSPGDPWFGAEPPNAVRKALWELEFDTVLNLSGTVEFDSVTVIDPTRFTNTDPIDLQVNFLKSVITVETLKGDLNLDGMVSPADVVWEIICVGTGNAPPAGALACDLNCDGEVTPADVVVMLIYKFVTLNWPC